MLKKFIKALLIAIIGLILFLIAFFHGRINEMNNKFNNIHIKMEHMMKRNLYSSQLASGSNIQIIHDSEKWTRKNKILKYSLEFIILTNGNIKRKYIAEVIVNLETGIMIQTYKKI